MIQPVVNAPMMAKCRFCGEMSETKDKSLNEVYLNFVHPHLKTCGKGKSYISEVIEWKHPEMATK